MDDLLQNRQIRRLLRNILLSQKRFTEAGDLTDEALEELLEGVSEDTLKHWYVNETIELDVFERLLDRKYNIEERHGLQSSRVTT